MDKATFWATKNPGPQYETVTFEHPAFDAPFRLVANEFAPITLGGQVYQPAPMTIQPPEQKSDTQPKLTLSFPRQVVGRAFKQQLAKIAAAGSREPIIVTYALFLGNSAAPALTWQLYASDAGGVAFNADTVQVNATDDNPMRLSCAPVYDPAIYTGLALL